MFPGTSLISEDYYWISYLDKWAFFNATHYVIWWMRVYVGILVENDV
jgi:hypothetical protein